MLCEKPMATSVEAAEAMVNAAADAKKVLMVGFTHRYLKHNQVAKGLLEDGAIGNPYMIRVRFAHDGPYKSWAADRWFFRPRRPAAAPFWTWDPRSGHIPLYARRDYQYKR